MAERLSHVDRSGRVKMVDVGDKPVTNREAVARGEITMSAAALKAIRTGAVTKGDPFRRAAGRHHGRQADVRVDSACAPHSPSRMSRRATPTRRGYRIESRLRTSAQTALEMEGWRPFRWPPDGLRHGQGRRQDDDHREHLPPRKREAKSGLFPVGTYEAFGRSSRTIRTTRKTRTL